jgi:pantetheine-phosphate adenylyltransferase
MTRRGSRPRNSARGRRPGGGAERSPLAAPRGPRVAVYPGSFDPVTRGHEDLIRRALTFADRVIVAVAVNVAKQPLFTLEERVALLREVVDRPEVEVRAFDGLLADFARGVGAAVIVRGLRAVSDFEYEFQMALMNRNLAPGIETVFLVPAFDLTYLSSSLVREVARFGGDVAPLVHPAVQQALRHKFPR